MVNTTNDARSHVIIADGTIGGPTFSGTYVDARSGHLILAGNNSVTVSPHLLPNSDNSVDLGSPSKRFANIHSADLHLSNEDTEGNEVDGTTGNWTIQEGEDDLYLLNRKNGKKYRFKLEEIK